MNNRNKFIGYLPSINLIIGSVCHTKCKYCFNPEENVNQKKYMSINDYIKCLVFLKKSKINSVRLLGGEPLIHPNISDILNHVLSDKYFKEIVIFSGGIFPDKIVKQLKHKKIKIIYNINNKANYLPNKYNRVISNLENISNEGIEITLGYNIFEKEFEWKEIVMYCVKYGISNLRVGIANPTLSHKTQILSLTERKQIGKQLYEFIVTAYKNKINVIFDCGFTQCIFNNSQWGKLLKATSFSLSFNGVCNPVLDVLPDLTVIRCFSLSSSEIVILSKFNNAKEIFEYFFSRFDSYKWFNKNINCKECSFFKNKTCQGGCLAFNGNVIDEYKNKSIMAEYSSKRAYDYCKNENLNLAVKSFKESLTYCFDNKIMCDYIYLLLKLGNIKEAIINFSKFENEIFQNNAFWLIKGFIEEVQGNYDVAIGNYRRALKNIKKEHKPFVKEKIKALS